MEEIKIEHWGGTLELLDTLELVDTPKELVKEFGSKCLKGTKENGQVFYTRARVTFISYEVEE